MRRSLITVSITIIPTSEIINVVHIPKPKTMQQIRKPGREKSNLYTISITIMHPPATIKCFGEEKTMCNLQNDKSIKYMT